MDEISHKGRIVSIDSCVTRVEILQTSACSECHAKSLCGFSEQVSKIVPVPTDGFAMRSVGDEVELCMKRSMGMKAVWISYVIPLIVLMATVLVASEAGAAELVTGLSGIAAVALYYVVILLFRNRLRNEFVFYIK
ncbi:MAG: SoxR reducing system RseC family protein [Bacteroidales bacterium]|nr:SoxR reducing system RseC family protein [Candidatus Hennigimonas equi]